MRAFALSGLLGLLRLTTQARFSVITLVGAAMTGQGRACVVVRIAVNTRTLVMIKNVSRRRSPIPISGHISK
jgi:hypothetical protein